MDGLLIVDKPMGPTSHDVVARVRRALGEERIGHTGTLDPLASGLLALVLGRATRLARFLSAEDKTYEAEVRLGVATDTYDAQGTEIAPAYEGAMPSRSAIEQAVALFVGAFMQQPPPYSAKKIAGRRSYALARANRPGPPALPAPVTVTAHAIDLVSVDADRVTLRINCSAGFYVRSLAHDLGARLGTGAHVTALRRTRAGDFCVADAIALDDVERNPAAAAAAVVPLASMLPGLAAAILTESGERHVAHGQAVGPADVQELRPSTWAGRGGVRLIDRQGRLLGIGEPMASSGLLHPSVVLM
jgi:tRNA pseudouridine55 synthase